MGLYEFVGGRVTVAVDPMGLLRNPFADVIDALTGGGDVFPDEGYGDIFPDEGLGDFPAELGPQNPAEQLENAAEELGEDVAEGIENPGDRAKCALRVYNEYRGAKPPEEYEGKPDAFSHCLVACEIARQCSLAEALFGSVAKEIYDFLDDRADSEWRDLMNDMEGIKCSRETEKSCFDCCTCQDTQKH